MSLNTITNQTIALAGISQAAALVQQLATKGTANSAALEASIGSLFINDKDGAANIFGGLSGITLGLEQLNEQMTGFKIANPDQARYAASLVFLERQLAKQPQLLSTIFAGIERAQEQSVQFGLLHENVLANLGDIYHNTVSTLQPRIMVNGEQEYLSRPDIVNKVRACLLAGIRSAILWQHCGGTRWKFLFYRKKIQVEIQNLLKQL
ncbi:MAG: high frequency lysogenization protein HflD [Methylococcaceae bacterium]|nr:high frequency lysogenization protein HflD [Methylococcaceae bacterium]MDZ4157373.1 high frequency lysogenization protein HflD [Methylococcales bacterium]MDP2392662.1 high frequency lysogenization protein HflD [Methylococcaceae bacterium]MDP3021163.1 high frequency lysogenization protein HflD [Methylococcaceae bacterium]MDP3390152.1 high frequency lysogenization protein HflD [Methylococcaceae bacterium]